MPKGFLMAFRIITVICLILSLKVFPDSEWMSLVLVILFFVSFFIDKFKTKDETDKKKNKKIKVSLRIKRS
ncbi:hypothetical protein OYT88_14685 [Sporolactobacillus sp. CQH2019]|uniref:hypothetical protein n=1 Tax=Sporolactobacillus sp. CQH2019 TaxID=3023512 RepID=UPI002368F281|nr:hypothetical protein [Sporolactobacillus sp. CQH2019]MDD9149798.1 hypothetical protein [Sporolactobacillus sp. CQH2019]